MTHRMWELVSPRTNIWICGLQAFCCCLVAKLCPTLCDPWTAAQQSSLSFISPRVCSSSCPLRQWYPPAISSSVTPFSSCPPSFSASESFPVSWLFASGGQNIGVSASASVLPMNIQDWFPLGLTVWSPCSPRDSQESSPTRQFESISYSILSFLHHPTLKSIRDYWKNHSFDSVDLCWQSNVFTFKHIV